VLQLSIGENSFESAREIERLTRGFGGEIYRLDGESLEVAQLPDLLMGSTLFSDKKLVIIKNLSANKTLWSVLSDWTARLSDDVHLVLVEAKPDKRTKTYKDLRENAAIKEFALWSERDATKAEQWVIEEAKANGFALDKKSAQALVLRIGVDQWLLYQAIQKLAVLPKVDAAVIENVIEAAPSENVFNLLDAALRGNAVKVRQMLQVLETTEDPYRLFGLLSGQVFQLAVLGVSEKPAALVASDLAAHPFALSKLAPYASKLGQEGARHVVAAFAEADAGMKTSVGEPWLLIERALLKTARLA
jgi:DNA polymerase III delta subunit